MLSNGPPEVSVIKPFDTHFTAYNKGSRDTTMRLLPLTMTTRKHSVSCYITYTISTIPIYR